MAQGRHVFVREPTHGSLDSRRQCWSPTAWQGQPVAGSRAAAERHGRSLASSEGLPGMSVDMMLS